MGSTAKYLPIVICVAVDLRDTCRISQIYECFSFYQEFLHPILPFQILQELFITLDLLLRLWKCFRMLYPYHLLHELSDYWIGQLIELFTLKIIEVHQGAKRIQEHIAVILLISTSSPYFKPNSLSRASKKSSFFSRVIWLRTSSSSSKLPSRRMSFTSASTPCLSLILRSVLMLGSLNIHFFSPKITSWVLCQSRKFCKSIAIFSKKKNKKADSLYSPTAENSKPNHSRTI